MERRAQRQSVVVAPATPALPTAERLEASAEPFLLQLQRVVGNRAVQRLVRDPACPIRRRDNRLTSLRRLPLLQRGQRGPAIHPTAVGGIIHRQDLGTATPAAPAAEPELAADFVEQELERFLGRFSAIEVQVPGQREPLRVHPPYFMNVLPQTRATAEPATTQRYDAAIQHREQLPGWAAFMDRVRQRVAARLDRENAAQGGGRERQSVGELVRRARVGKGTPETIQDVLEQALADGLIRPPAGHTQLTAADLRTWLERYGIGIDCTGFVAQALDHVLAEGYEQRGGSPREAPYINPGSRPTGSGFAPVEHPSDLQPGDTMNIPGHVRILVRVAEREGGIEFTTAEARAGTTDIGPDSGRWRFPDPASLANLKKWMPAPGLAINRERTGLGTSLQDLARLSGVSVEELNQIESGQITSSTEQLDRIATALLFSRAELEAFHGFMPVEEEPTFSRWTALQQFRTEHVADGAEEAP